MEDGLTLVVTGSAIQNINNYVTTPVAGASESVSHDQDAGAASSGPEDTNNVPQSNSLPVEMVKSFLQEAVSDISGQFTQAHHQILQEVKEIRESQEISQRDIAELKKDRERDRKMYVQLQEQHAKLRQKNEETITRLKDLNMQRCEMAKKLESLEVHRDSLLKEVKMLQERQGDAEQQLYDIQDKEQEIEHLKSKIFDLEKTIDANNETSETDRAQICELNEQIEKLKEEKEIIKQGSDDLSKEVHDLKDRNDILANALSSSAFKNEFEAKGVPLKPKPPHPSLSKYRTRDIPKEHAFVGTTSSKASHNIVHKKDRKFAFWERHQ